MKKYGVGLIAAVFIMVMISPFCASAAEKEKIQLTVEGGQAGVSLTLPESVRGNVSTLQMSLKIDSDIPEQITAVFHFPEEIAKIADYRYHQAEGLLNIYLSDTESLF